jgi:hypothetical protein
MERCSKRLYKLQVRKHDDHGLVQLLYDDDSGEDSATDRHISGEGALLVDVVTLARRNVLLKFVKGLAEAIYYL